MDFPLVSSGMFMNKILKGFEAEIHKEKSGEVFRDKPMFSEEGFVCFTSKWEHVVRVSLYQGWPTLSRFLYASRFRVLVWFKFLLLLVGHTKLPTYMLIIHSKEVMNLKYIMYYNIKRYHNYA